MAETLTHKHDEGDSIFGDQPYSYSDKFKRLREIVKTPLGLTGAAVTLMAVTAGGTALALHGEQEPAQASGDKDPNVAAPIVPGKSHPETPAPSSGGFNNIDPVSVRCMGTLIQTVKLGEIYLVTPIIEDAENVGDPRTSPYVYTVSPFLDPYGEAGEYTANVANNIGAVTWKPQEQGMAPNLAVVDFSQTSNPPSSPQEVKAMMPLEEQVPDDSIFPCPISDELERISAQYPASLS